MMRVLSLFIQLPLLLSSLVLFPLHDASLVLAATPTPISHVQVTLKGKKYDIEDVTTVSELQERLQEASGITISQQGRILFQGKKLTASPTSSLSEAGVSPGDMLNCVPSTGKSKKKSSTKTTTTTTSTTTATTSTSTPSEAATANPNASMQEMLKAAGVDPSNMEDMVNQMMGSGGSGEMPSMAESMQAMSSMMKSPIFTEYMNDPEKLEQSRQMILQNPMLKQMMSSMPGMEELLNDPEAWSMAMKQAAELYSNMDQNDLMQAMMQGADARMTNPEGGGLFGDMAAEQPPTALDELSEGEE
jgi:hypothetical protein